MKKIIDMTIRMMFGFLLCACGTVLALNSKLGLSPWDVFHQGLTNVINITMGQASIVIGIVIVLISSLLGVRIGLATIANMIMIGFFIDLVSYIDIIPVSSNIFSGIIMMIGSLFSLAFGTYLYIGCGMGCGPRDGLMVALVRITGKSVRLIRFVIEMCALTIGYFLGGKAGIGTVITVFGIGYCVQLVFKMFNFDVNALKHKDIKEGIRSIRQLIVNS